MEPNGSRAVRGGLDNAVLQAERRRLYDYFIVDTDCHAAEPFQLLARYLPEDLRSLFTVKTEVDPSGRDASKSTAEKPAALYKYTYGKGKSTATTKGLGHGSRILRPEVSYPREQSPEEVINLFTRRMAEIGIKRSLLFPDSLLHLANYPDHRGEIALCDAYMDYMLEHYLGKYPEILCAMPIPVNSPDRAAELIDRVGSEKGVASIMLGLPMPPLMGDDCMDPIYEAAQKKGLPIAAHVGVYRGGFFEGFDDNLSVHALSFVMHAMQHLTSCVIKGVPERFPHLNFAWIETGVTWIPWIMHRLDNYYERRSMDAPLLRRMPSEYIKEFYFASQPIERPLTGARDLEPFFKAFDAENHLMFASDYPHFDMDLPSAIYDLPFLTETAKRKILGENAARLFRLSSG